MDHRQLLIIEDDPGLQRQMRWCLDEVNVEVAGNPKEAEAALRRFEPQVVTLDLGLPPAPEDTRVGLEMLRRIRELSPHTKVIVITGAEERGAALRAIDDGAYDFYHKPIDGETLKFVVDRAFRLTELEAENRALAAQADHTPLDGVIAASACMLKVCRTVERVAPADATVLVNGETGTGKEVIARAIHQLSDRADGPFVAINCAAIPENLLESELFGHEKGAFTGASARKIGKIEHASGGTLFLDEIGDMPLPLQAKILRFLQERTVERIGSNQTIPVDVRVVSATHRVLDDMIAEGSFREDLYFRIAEIPVLLPPVRERDQDVILLAQALVRKYADKRKLKLSAGARAAMLAWSWPGNVRELENRVKRACIMTEGPDIIAEDLDLEAPEAGADEVPFNLRVQRDAAERQAVETALAHAKENLAQAARLLGISRPTLYNLLEKHHIATG